MGFRQHSILWYCGLPSTALSYFALLQYLSLTCFVCLLQTMRPARFAGQQAFAPSFQPLCRNRSTLHARYCWPEANNYRIIDSALEAMELDASAPGLHSAGYYVQIIDSWIAINVVIPIDCIKAQGGSSMQVWLPCPVLASHTRGFQGAKHVALLGCSR